MQLGEARTWQCRECGFREDGDLPVVRCRGCGAVGCFELSALADAPAAVDADLSWKPEVDARSLLSSPRAVPQPIEAVEVDVLPRRPTGIGELDRVLGLDQSSGRRGLVAGQVVLIAGPPGVGKSTLLLQMLSGLCAAGLGGLYASAEESEEQVAQRARRLGLRHVDVLATRQLGDVEAALADGRYAALILDSLQTMAAPGLAGSAGSPNHVRAVADRMAALAKATGLVVVLVGQVTKDDQLAGPMAAKHAIDTFLWMEREAGYRLLRTRKNRFGPEGELGVFRMTGDRGLVEVEDPSETFVAERLRGGEGVSGTVWTIAADVDRPMAVEVQVLIAADRSSRRVIASGIDASRLGILQAVLARRAGVQVEGDVYVDLHGLRSAERVLDLPLALALVSAAQGHPIPASTVAFGEVALTGEVRRVPRLDARLREAARLGFAAAVVPPSPSADLDVGRQLGLELVVVGTVGEALDCLLEGS